MQLQSSFPIPAITMRTLPGLDWVRFAGRMVAIALVYNILSPLYSESPGTVFKKHQHNNKNFGDISMGAGRNSLFSRGYWLQQ